MSLVGYMTAPRLLASNLALVQGYRPSTVFTGVLPSWSLVVEVGFYVLLPIAAISARRSVVLPPALLLAGGLAAKVCMTITHFDDVRGVNPTWASVLTHSFLGYADLFAYGMAAAVVFVHWRRTSTPPWVSGAVAGRALAYLGLPLTVFGFYFLPGFAYASVVAVLCAAVLLRVTAPASRANRLRSPLMRGSGRISYSVFLWNFPALSFLQVHHLLVPGHGAAAFAGNLVVAAVTVGTLSALTYRFVEAPALRRGRRRRDLSAPATATAAG